MFDAASDASCPLLIPIRTQRQVPRPPGKGSSRVRVRVRARVRARARVRPPDKG